MTDECENAVRLDQRNVRSCTTLAVWKIALVTAALHLVLAGRYDYFRDELYFIICGRHPAFGYVDQPPLVPLLAAATQAFGQHLWLLRLVPSLAAAATVLVVCAFARTAGAGRFGEAAAGVAAALAPMLLGVSATFNTNALDPLLWTLLAWLMVRAVSGEPRAFIWAGVAAGVALEAKYALPLYLGPLLLALIATGQGRALLRREALIGAALAVLLAAPSAIWQLTHGLPFLEVM